MTIVDSLVVDLSEIRCGVGIRVTTSPVLPDMHIGHGSIVDGCANVDVEVTAHDTEVVADGTVGVRWSAPCRRCLEDVRVQIEIDFQEIFEVDPTEGETWPIMQDRIDLSDPVRHVALLAIPLAPLCSSDCAGPEPERFATGTVQVTEPTELRDPRWAALDLLRFDD